MQSTSCEMPGWMAFKMAGRNVSNLRYADDTTLMAESEEELKCLLMKVKEKSRKAGLKLSIQKMKIMASSPMTLWQIDGETVCPSSMGPEVGAGWGCHPFQCFGPRV